MGTTLELLANPFCMADRDSQTVAQACVEAGLNCRILNIWEIKEPMDDIPSHVAQLVREYRRGERPGSVYSSVFVNGARLLLNRWSGSPTHLETLKDMIAAATRENRK